MICSHGSAKEEERNKTEDIHSRDKAEESCPFAEGWRQKAGQQIQGCPTHATTNSTNCSNITSASAARRKSIESFECQYSKKQNFGTV